jgi:adenylate cyclase
MLPPSPPPAPVTIAAPLLTMLSVPTTWVSFARPYRSLQRCSHGSCVPRRTVRGVSETPEGEPHRLTFLQRQSLKKLVKVAKKRPGEPLSPEDWRAYFEFTAQPSNRMMKRVLRALPSTPRCGFCGAPFAGLGGRLVRPLGFRPSRKNPNLCATCVELAPPGGLTTDVGVVFADLRGFTARSESLTPEQASAVLRRFYACAEHVFFPEAMIDKFIGDEVMALYVPMLVMATRTTDQQEASRHVAGRMLAHARELLERAGYGTSDGPAFEVGVGLDFGEAFIGNLGEGAVYDFTAVGDVVNTASRLQAQAAGGEVVVSHRVARLLDEPLGEPERLELKGKQEPFTAYRVRWFGTDD